MLTVAVVLIARVVLVDDVRLDVVPVVRVIATLVGVCTLIVVDSRIFAVVVASETFDRTRSLLVVT